MPYEIIPTILVQNRLEFVRRLDIIQGTIPTVQMDIMDGKFVKNTTFTDPKIAAKYKIDYELDLMVEDPTIYIEAWKNVSTVKRALVHIESKKFSPALLAKIKSCGWEAGIALNPDTEWEVVKPFLPPPQSSPTQRTRAELGAGQARGEEARTNSPPLVGGARGGGTFVDSVLFMTVYPGQNGAAFQESVVPKIKALHAAYPHLSIEVDGGVNETTLPLLLKAGVSRFAVGSAIWNTGNPLTSYQNLLKRINGRTQ